MSQSPDPEDDKTLIRPPSSAPTLPGPGIGGLATQAMPREATPDRGDNPALPVGTLLGEFELTRVLGIGGFGIVYLANDRQLGRRVALKEYMPGGLATRVAGATVSVKSERHREAFDAGLRSFVNEAKLLARFDHPSLVKVYHFWEGNGTAYMVMPYYEGLTLKQHLGQLDAAGQTVSEAWLRGLLAPLTEAISVLHAERCYHRDIAPDNIILLAGSGRPLLLDFGAARQVIRDMTHALTVILKPGYAPPEQYDEAGGVAQGPWTDVYALAAVVHFAITGKPPPESVGRLMNDRYVPLAQRPARRCSDAFLQAIDRALRVRPAERTQSIDILRSELGLADALAFAPLPAGQVAALPATAAPTPTRTEAFPATEAVSAPAPTVAATVATAATAAPAATTAITPATTAGRAEAAAPATAPAAAASGRSPALLWAGGGAALLVLGGAAAYFALTPRGVPAPPVAVAPLAGPAAQASAPAAAVKPTAPAAVQPAAVAVAPAASVAAPAAPVASAGAVPAATPAPAAPPATATTAPPSVAVVPASASTATPPQRSAGEFSVNAEFDALLRDQTPGFAVQAQAPRPRLQIGKNLLKFNVTSARDGHVYVLVLGPDHSLTLLLPNSTQRDIRIGAGQTLSLPPPTVPIATTEPAGREDFLVLVSATPRSFDGLGGKRESTFLTLPSPTRLGALAAKFSGRGSVLGGQPSGCSGDACWDYGASRFSVDVAR